MVEIDFEQPHLPNDVHVDIVITKLTDILVGKRKNIYFYIAERWKVCLFFLFILFFLIIDQSRNLRKNILK